MTVRTQTGSLAAPGAADPAPWLPQAPVLGFMVLWSYGFMVPAATRSTRSSLRAPRPRREDAARRPAMLIPRHGCHWRRREAQQGAAFGRPGARTRPEQPSSAPAEKVRRERPVRAPPQVPLLVPIMAHFSWFISLAPPWRNEEQPPGAPERGRGPSSLRALPRRRCGASCLRAPPQAPLLVPIMVHFNSISVGSAGLRQCQFPRRPRSRDRTSTAPEDPAVPVAMPPRARCLTRPAPAVKAMPG